MEPRRIVLAAIFCTTLASCAVSTPIQDASRSESQFDKAVIYDGERKEVQPPLPGKEMYRIFHQGATGFTPLSAIRASAMKRMVEFCEFKGKQPYLVEETTSKPPHLFGNWPRIEIVFSCVEPSSTEGANPQQLDKYDQIEKLKRLLDEGAITQEEYEQEKQEILKQKEVEKAIRNEMERRRIQGVSGDDCETEYKTGSEVCVEITQVNLDCDERYAGDYYQDCDVTLDYEVQTDYKGGSYIEVEVECTVEIEYQGRETYATQSDSSYEDESHSLYAHGSESGTMSFNFSFSSFEEITNVKIGSAECEIESVDIY